MTYSKVVIRPPGGASQSTAIVYDGKQIVADADGLFTICNISSVTFGQYMASGWTLKAFVE
jgi:hypothetical protein